LLLKIYCLLIYNALLKNLVINNPFSSLFLNYFCIMISNFHSITGLKIYNEIINGHLRPFLPENSKLSKIKHLVREENTQTILRAVDKKKVRQLLDEMDLTIYGYRSMDDIILDIKVGPDGNIADVTIKPRKSYDLNDYIDIPPAPDQKSAFFLSLMADEFERIKIRSNKIMDNCDCDRKLSLYANKHIQKVKHIAHDARILYSKILDKEQFISDNSDIYILFVINLFLIRLIVYYRKFFKPFVSPVNESEEDLRLEFYHSLPPHKKYPYVFRHLPSTDSNIYIAHDSGDPGYQKKSYPDFPHVYNASTPAEHDNSSATFSEKKSHPVNQGVQDFEKYPLNCQVNVIVDHLLTLSTKSYRGGRPVLNMKPAQIADFIERNFFDDDGNDISSSTLRTLLKPYRADKRLKSGSPKRLDSSDLYGD
jgi:hypothetical protein